MVLPDSEVRIGDMSQFHGWRMRGNALKSKNLGGLESVRVVGALERGDCPSRGEDFAVYPAAETG